MRLPSRIIMVLVAALAVAACQYQARDAADLLWPDLNDPYLSETRRATRSEAVYDGMNLSFAAAATLKTRPWREAYARRHAALYGQTEAEQAEVLAGQMRAAEAGTELVLALTAPDGSHRDLALRDPRWKVFALSGQNKLYPLEIRPMERDVWPQDKLEAFFPYATRWRRFYSVRFAPVQAGPLSLVVTGPAGRVELSWVYFE